MGIAGQTVAFLVAKEGIEQVELTEPWKAVKEAGGVPQLVSAEPGTVQGYHHLDRGDTFDVDKTLAEVRAADFAALVLPGGVANGDQVRMQPAAVELVKEFTAQGRPVGAICHGGWVLVEADAVGGRRMTSWPSMKTDFRNAGADWTDEEVVVDNTGYPLVTSRKPDDLPAFCRELVAAIDKA